MSMANRNWQKSLSKIAKNVGFYLLLLLLFFPFFFVFFWMVQGAFKTQIQNTAVPPIFIFEPTLQNFETVFRRNPMWQFLRNSAFVAIGATSLGLLFGLPAAYVIAKYKLKLLAIIILVGRIIPAISLLVPWFIMFSRLGLIGTYTVLILSHLLITLPMTIWLMIGFFEDIPKELDEAALIDNVTTQPIEKTPRVLASKNMATAEKKPLGFVAHLSSYTPAT
jgi:multiple sugar transport system permease protein